MKINANNAAILDDERLVRIVKPHKYEISCVKHNKVTNVYHIITLDTTNSLVHAVFKWLKIINKAEYVSVSIKANNQ